MYKDMLLSSCILPIDYTRIIVYNIITVKEMPSGKDEYKMTGFEYSQTVNTIEEKTAVLILDAIKKAYNMAGIDFDSLTEEEKLNAINTIIK